MIKRYDIHAWAFEDGGVWAGWGADEDEDGTWIRVEDLREALKNLASYQQELTTLLLGE